MSINSIKNYPKPRIINLLLSKIKTIEKFINQINSVIYSKVNKEYCLNEIKRMMEIINGCSNLEYKLNDKVFINLIDLLK